MPISNKEASDVVDIIWRHFDTDNNGSLDPDEIKLLLEFLCYLNDSRFNEELKENLFEDVDKNKDGKITKDELIEILVQNV